MTSAFLPRKRYEVTAHMADETRVQLGSMALTSLQLQGFREESFKRNKNLRALELVYPDGHSVWYRKSR